MRVNDRCCCCDGVNRKTGEKIHVEHNILQDCLNPECSHQCCEDHRESCGFCTGCCAELHGLNFHDKRDDNGR